MVINNIVISGKKTKIRQGNNTILWGGKLFYKDNKAGFLQVSIRNFSVSTLRCRSEVFIQRVLT